MLTLTLTMQLLLAFEFGEISVVVIAADPSGLSLVSITLTVGV